MPLDKRDRPEEETLVVRVNTVPWIHEFRHWEGVVLLMLIIPGLETVGKRRLPTLDVFTDLIPHPNLLLKAQTAPASITKSRQKVRHVVGPNFSLVLSYSLRDVGINHFQIEMEALFVQEAYSDAFSNIGPKSYTPQVDRSRMPLFVYRSEKGKSSTKMMLRIFCHLGELLRHT